MGASSALQGPLFPSSCVTWVTVSRCHHGSTWKILHPIPKGIPLDPNCGIFWNLKFHGRLLELSERFQATPVQKVWLWGCWVSPSLGMHRWAGPSACKGCTFQTVGKPRGSGLFSTIAGRQSPASPDCPFKIVTPRLVKTVVASTGQPLASPPRLSLSLVSLCLSVPGIPILTLCWGICPSSY